MSNYPSGFSPTGFSPTEALRVWSLKYKIMSSLVNSVKADDTVKYALRPRRLFTVVSDVFWNDDTRSFAVQLVALNLVASADHLANHCTADIRDLTKVSPLEALADQSE